MNYHKKIANAGHEEAAEMTTRHYGRHGLPRGLRREKKVRNRAAKREDRVNAFNLEFAEN